MIRLAISSLAFGRALADADLQALACLGVAGIELAPLTQWACWQDADASRAAEFRERLARFGLAVPALQGIFFNADVAGLFEPGGRQSIARHLGLVAPLAQALGAGVLVFGAPRLRALPAGGRMTPAIAGETVDAFRQFGDICAASDCVLAIEPCPASMGCDFLRSTLEAAAFVEQVGSAHVRLHLDLGALHANAEDLSDVWHAAGPAIRHCHLSEPGLGALTGGVVPQAGHVRFLAEAGYRHWVSIEMNRVDRVLDESTVPWAALRQACSAVPAAGGAQGS